MSIASVMGGLALANARLGAVHGYASVLGGMFEGAAHGAICAALLPHVFRKNAEKLGIRWILTITLHTFTLSVDISLTYWGDRCCLFRGSLRQR